MIRWSGTSSWFRTARSTSLHEHPLRSRRHKSGRCSTRLMIFARRNNFGFNLTYIAKNLPSPTSFGFEAGYMRSLYQYGYDKAKTGDFWAKSPPSDDLSQNDGRYRK